MRTLSDVFCIADKQTEYTEMNPGQPQVPSSQYNRDDRDTPAMRKWDAGTAYTV